MHTGERFSGRPPRAAGCITPSLAPVHSLTLLSLSSASRLPPPISRSSFHGSRVGSAGSSQGTALSQALGRRLTNPRPRSFVLLAMATAGAGAAGRGAGKRGGGGRGGREGGGGGGGRGGGGRGGREEGGGTFTAVQSEAAMNWSASSEDMTADRRPDPPEPPPATTKSQSNQPFRVSYSELPLPPERRDDSGELITVPDSKGDFEALIASGETRKFSLTPGRLQTMEVRPASKQRSRLVPRSAVEEYEALSRIRGDDDGESSQESDDEGKHRRKGPKKSGQQTLYEFLTSTGPEDVLPFPPTGKRDSSYRPGRKPIPGKSRQGETRKPSGGIVPKLTLQNTADSKLEPSGASTENVRMFSLPRSDSSEFVGDSQGKEAAQLPRQLVPHAPNNRKTDSGDVVRPRSWSLEPSRQSEPNLRRRSAAILDKETDLRNLPQPPVSADASAGRLQAARGKFASTGSLASTVSSHSTTTKQTKSFVRNILKLAPKKDSSLLSVAPSPDSSLSARYDSAEVLSRGESPSPRDGSRLDSKRPRSATTDKRENQAHGKGSPGAGLSTDARSRDAPEALPCPLSIGTDSGILDDAMGSSWHLSIPSFTFDLSDFGLSDMSLGMPGLPAASPLSAEEEDGREPEGHTRSHSEASEGDLFAHVMAVTDPVLHSGLPSFVDSIDDEMRTTPTLPSTPAKQRRGRPDSTTATDAAPQAGAPENYPPPSVQIRDQSQRKPHPPAHGKPETVDFEWKTYLEQDALQPGEQQKPRPENEQKTDAIEPSPTKSAREQTAPSPQLFDSRGHAKRDLRNPGQPATPESLGLLRSEVPRLLAAGDETARRM
ncbi:MAG: hypothetical protein BJ554DRAFT_2916, partial [Olpidium bornovanus]